MKRLLAVVLALALCLGLFVTAASAREAGYGDVDGNGTINASDALQVLRHAVGKTRLNGEQQTLADVDADDAINAYVSPLVNYSLDDDDMRFENPVTNTFTVKALYRLGFQWSITETHYLEPAIQMMEMLGFFDL